jgi:hypothetical protein
MEGPCVDRFSDAIVSVGPEVDRFSKGIGTAAPEIRSEERGKIVSLFGLTGKATWKVRRELSSRRQKRLCRRSSQGLGRPWHRCKFKLSWMDNSIPLPGGQSGIREMRPLWDQTPLSRWSACITLAVFHHPPEAVQVPVRSLNDNYYFTHYT